MVKQKGGRKGKDSRVEGVQYRSGKEKQEWEREAKEKQKSRGKRKMKESTN